MTKVDSKRTGHFRRTNPVVQPELSDDELLMKAFAKENCSKCYGTGRKRILVVRGSRIMDPCKCVPTSLFYHWSY
jgi:hypothetical protein